MVTPSPVLYQVWAEEPRRILAPPDFGLADEGSVIADSDIVRLPDGRLRVYILAGDAETLRLYGEAPLRSAVSSDGLHWSPEPGLRCTRPVCPGSPAIAAIPTGGWRLFFDDAEGIVSVVTQDGLTFTREPGLRIRFADLKTHPGWAFGSGHVVRLKAGGWRMYFGDSFTNGFVFTPLTQVYSAHSDNLLDWVIDPGVRAQGVVHPFVLQQTDGSFRMFAAALGQANLDACCIVTATSADGLTWSPMESTGLNGGDPVAFVTPDGETRLYYNDVSLQPVKLGGYFSAHMVGASWGVSIDAQSQQNGQHIIQITAQVKGSGPAVTVQAIDAARVHPVAVAGLPYVGMPPFQVKFEMRDTSDALIELTDGTIARIYIPHASASDFGGATTCGAGTGPPCPSPNCGYGTGTPCPPTPLPSGLAPCEDGQPIPPQGCTAVGGDGSTIVCLPKGQDPHPPPRCNRWY